jgi:hypothetical protein
MVKGAPAGFKPDKCFVLIELPSICIQLVDHVDDGVLGVRSKICIDVISICACGPLDVAVMGGHLHGPLIAVLANT